MLHVLHDVLQSHYAGLLEQSAPTFEAFCKHYDPAQFAADSEHLKQYDDIVAKYASYASKQETASSKSTLDGNIATQNRSAAIQAIKSLVTADSFAADTGRQLRLVTSAVLANVYSETPGLLPKLRLREKAKLERDKEKDARPRPSTAVSATENSEEDDSTTAFETTEDADERANEDVAILAMQTLRQIFSTEVPAQLRIAAQCFLSFIRERKHASKSDLAGPKTIAHIVSWSTDLLEMMSGCAPVQSRFIILVTITDALTKSPILEDDLVNQLILIRVIASLLRCDTSFIGLSVNDVLIGFVNHILLLLQLGGPDSGVKPHRQQTVAHGLLDVTRDSSRDHSPASGRTGDGETVGVPTEIRIQLLHELSMAIGDLATHIYYADQISEMVAALLMRLKPPINVIPSTTVAIENPSGAAGAIAESVRLQENPQTDEYFSFDTARVLALSAIKNIFETANMRRKDGQGGTSRNRVGVIVWDGTQWLLRDPKGKVRRAYVDTLLTWLFLELDKSDLRLPQEHRTGRKVSKPNDPMMNGNINVSRALSSASKRSIPNLRAHSTFMQLLHLAIYENALQYAESEADIMLLHHLLVLMIRKLGLNSVRHGLPMIFRLQEDMLELESQSARCAIGTLVHGYFWALSQFFDFDASEVGRSISSEIARRKHLGTWLQCISVPLLPFEQVPIPPDVPPAPSATASAQQTSKPQPFLDREDLVECISQSYSGSLLSPPSSPAVSPRRPLSPRPSSHKAPAFTGQTQDSFPRDVQEQLMHTWSRERIIAEVDNKPYRSSSMAKSKSGSGSNRGAGALLNANGGGAGGLTPEGQLSRKVSDIDLARPSSQNARSSVSAPASGSVSGKQSVRVNDLQRILETGQQPGRALSRFQSPGYGSDVDTESLVSAGVSTAT